MKDQVTVKAAALAIGKDRSRIYAWIRDERLTTWEDREGITFVSMSEVIELDARMFKRRNNRKTHLER